MRRVFWKYKENVEYLKETHSRPCKCGNCIGNTKKALNIWEKKHSRLCKFGKYKESFRNLNEKRNRPCKFVKYQESFEYLKENIAGHVHFEIV